MNNTFLHLLNRGLASRYEDLRSRGFASMFDYYMDNTDFLHCYNIINYKLLRKEINEIKI